jgi:hypothetical protein
MPHPPQFALSVDSFTHCEPQSVVPVGQVHTLAMHTREPVHALPHMPQFMRSVASDVHVPEQSVCPLAHPHALDEHVIPPPQLMPHAPQFVVLVARFTSHPFDGFASQSANPVMHVNPHAPAEQTATALAGVGHACPHIPQFAIDVWRFASHPSAAIALQLPKPAAQLPTAHPDVVHTAVAFESMHTVPHAPQFVADECKSVSQPLPATRSQSP